MELHELKYLVTGSSGFFGKILADVLKRSGAVSTLDAVGPAAYLADITSPFGPLPGFDLVIHAAGKAHMVPKTPEESQQFFNVNVTGTSNLLEALEKNLPKTFVLISSVAVYGTDTGTDITEDHPLKGSTPYAESKIRAEMLAAEWGIRHNVPVAILRLPLLAGPNPPGNLGAMIRAIQKGYYFRISAGNARRSMVLAKDVAEFIPSLAGRSGIWHLTDGHHPSFRELEEAILAASGRKHRISIPLWAAKIAASAGDLIPFLPLNTNRLEKLTGTLTFSDSKARMELGWTSRKAMENLSI